MKLTNYAFLTDENINPIIVQSLRQRGCDVFDVKEQGLQGNSDTFLLSLATRQNRVVLTHDSDFGTLVIAEGKPFIGIVYLKPGHILPHFTLQSLEAVFNEVGFIETPFIVVAKNNGEATKVRVRQL